MNTETMKINCLLEGDSAIDFERLSMEFKGNLYRFNRQKQQAAMVGAAMLVLDASYYQVLEQAQSGDMDITTWLEWFCKTLDRAFEVALSAINTVLEKRRFWQQFHAAGLSPEQVKVLNRLLDGGERGFAGGISAAQYQKVAKVSKATATRHLADLVNKGCVEKLPAGGRSTRYHVPTVV